MASEGLHSASSVGCGRSVWKLHGVNKGMIAILGAFLQRSPHWSAPLSRSLRNGQPARRRYPRGDLDGLHRSHSDGRGRGYVVQHREATLVLRG